MQGMATDFVQQCIQVQNQVGDQAHIILDLIVAGSAVMKQVFCTSADSSGMTPLHAACRAVWREAVEILVGLCPDVANWYTHSTGRPLSYTPLLCMCDVMISTRDVDAFERATKDMSAISDVLLPAMSVEALKATTSTGGNFGHVLASRAQRTVLANVLAALSELHGMELVKAILNNWQDARRTVADQAGHSDKPKICWSKTSGPWCPRQTRPLA